MPDDWSWTPDETGLDDDAPMSGTAGWFAAHPPPTGTFPEAFWEALESFADTPPCGGLGLSEGRLVQGPEGGGEEEADHGG